MSGNRPARTARLDVIAIEILEDAETAARWFKSPHRALDDRAPLRLSETDVGGRAVEALLGRMEHGVST